MMALQILSLFVGIVATDPSAALDEPSLKELAKIVEAYHASIETLVLRLSAQYTDEPAYRKIREADPHLWGPDVIQRTEYVEAPGGLRSFRDTIERNGKMFSAREDFKNGDIAYSFEYAQEDPSIITTVAISRNYRGEAEGLGGRPPEILYGLLVMDGRPLFAVLNAPDTILLGRKEIAGSMCFEIEATVRGQRVVYCLDPKHDYLCVRWERRPTHESVTPGSPSWHVSEFTRVADRWFPRVCIRDMTKMIGDKLQIACHCTTTVEEIEVNKPINRDRFQPKIPDGAVVHDYTKGELVTYIQGGNEAGKQVAARLQALREPKEQSGNKRIVVGRSFGWLAWAGALLAVASAVVLFLAAWMRYKQSAE